VSLVRSEHLSFHATMFCTTALLILAGVFAGRYAYGSGYIWCLIGYVLCLGGAACMTRQFSIAGINRACDDRRATGQNERRATASMAEDIGINKASTKSVTSERVVHDGAREFVQQSLDLDGMEELRSLGEVTGQWFVCHASDKAADLVKTACLALVDGGDVEIERAERWFDIASGLRSRECQVLPKAELRRSYVADSVGVSKEQVRQIDQGRYAPLNKLLHEIDPKDL